MNKEHMDLDSVTFGIMQMLDILNKEEQSIDMEDSHMIQIKEYLTLLDLIMEIELESLPEVSRKSKVTVITQPGMRYAQANAIVENMLLDAKFQELSIVERNCILERLLSEIRGRMMEDIILLETKIAKPDKKVFKLQFAIGEFDMVVFDSKTLTCEIYEVKYSAEQVLERYYKEDKQRLNEKKFSNSEKILTNFVTCYNMNVQHNDTVLESWSNLTNWSVLTLEEYVYVLYS